MSSVVLETRVPTGDTFLVKTHAMNYNGSHFLASLEVTLFSATTVYYKIIAKDNTGNAAESIVYSIELPQSGYTPSLTLIITISVVALSVTCVAYYLARRPDR